MKNKIDARDIELWLLEYKFVDLFPPLFFKISHSRFLNNESFIGQGSGPMLSSEGSCAMKRSCHSLAWRGRGSLGGHSGPCDAQPGSVLPFHEAPGAHVSSFYLCPLPVPLPATFLTVSTSWHRLPFLSPTVCSDDPPRLIMRDC